MRPCPPFRQSFVLGALILLTSVALGAAAQGRQAAQRAREALGTYETEHAAQLQAITEGLYADADARGAKAHAALLDAKAAYELAASVEKNDLLDYADVLELLGFDDLLGEAMERGVTKYPEDALLWAKLGAAKIRCGPKHEARGLEALRKSITLDPDCTVCLLACTALGALYYEQGLYDLAREALEKAAAPQPKAQPLKSRKYPPDTPDNAEAVIRLAVLQVREGKIAEANAALDALGQAARPFDAMTRVLLRDALETYENDGRYFDDTAPNHVAFSKLLYRAGRLPEAVLAASRATRLDPKDTKTFNFIGSIYLQLGNADAARQAYEKSLEADPGQSEVAQVLEQIRAQAAAKPAPPTAPAVPNAPPASTP